MRHPRSLLIMLTLNAVFPAPARSLPLSSNIPVRATFTMYSFVHPSTYLPVPPMSPLSHSLQIANPSLNRLSPSLNPGPEALPGKFKALRTLTPSSHSLTGSYAHRFPNLSFSSPSFARLVIPHVPSKKTHRRSFKNPFLSTSLTLPRKFTLLLNPMTA